MALVSFIDFSTGQRITDNILVDFYLSTDVNLTQIIDAGYTLNGTVNAPRLNAGFDYIIIFTGSYKPLGLYYVSVLSGTNSAVVTLNHPISSFVSGTPVGPVGPQGMPGVSGLFNPPTTVFPFTVGQYTKGNTQLLVLTDTSPFSVGTLIQLIDIGIGKSGVWQVTQTTGTYSVTDGTIYPLSANHILVSAIDLKNLPYGFGCVNGDVFRPGMTKVVYGAIGTAGSFATSSDVALSNPQNNDILVYQNGKITNIPALIHEIYTYSNNVPANQTILRYVFSRNVVLNGGLGQSNTRPFVSAVFSIRRNKIEIGTITFAPDGSTACTLSGTSPVNFTYKDIIEIISPTVKDVSLADIAITLTGYRI